MHQKEAETQGIAKLFNGMEVVIFALRPSSLPHVAPLFTTVRCHFSNTATGNIFMMTETQHPKVATASPFNNAAAASSVLQDAHDGRMSDQPVEEDVSDGLRFCRRTSSWLLPTYTRKDCRCGHCSLGDEDPCPYAKPETPSALSSMLSSGRRSLSRMLSTRDQAATAKDT